MRARQALALEPFGDKPVASVNVDLAKTSAAGVDELVGNSRLDDQDLSGARLHGVRADGVRRLPLQDNEDLLVSMPVEARTAAWLLVDEDEADVGAAILAALQL